MKDTRFLQLRAASNAGISSADYQSMASAEWLSKLDKRTADRTPDDISQILAGLQNFQPLQRLHPSLLRHMSQYAFCEAVEKNVTLFREGDITKNWYAVVEGRLRVIKGGQNYVIGKGAVFEEITSYDNKRKLTVVTKEFCNLIRLERKQMKLFCKSHPYQLKDVLATTVLELDQIERPSDIDGDLDTALAPPPRITVNSHSDQHNGVGDASLPDSSGFDNAQAETGLDPALLDLEGVKPRSPPISETQASLLLTSIIDSFPDFVHPQLGRKHCISAEHLMTYVADVTQAQSMKETLGICQVLLEDAVIKPLDRKTPITDFQTTPTFVYFFPNVSPQDSIDEDELQSLLDDLIRHGGDALLRMTLRKAPELRTEEDLDFIYNELLHIKALAHLSTMIKRELAKVVLLESHSNAGTVLFNQGDEGTSWYIILKGSVNVVIYGKGVVCSLHEGDDFGKLALVNDAPRAASIILREPCHFLRVDKNDFNRILRDVEANTVRLKEHGTDVLILEKIGGSTRGSKDKNHRYSVMAGTAEKVLEYMLDSRLDDNHQDPNDFLLEDYLLTYPLFISTDDLCSNLMRYYNSKIRQTADGESAKNRSLLNRKHVVAFIRCWFEVDNDVMFQKAGVRDFLKTLADAVYHDASQYDLKEQHMTMEEIMDACEKYFEELQSAQAQRQLNVSSDSNKSDDISRPIRPTDETIVKIYNGLDINSYTAVRVTADTRTSVVLKLAAKKLQVEGPVVLAEIKSNGEYNLYKDDEMSIETKLSVNGRLFCCTKEQLAHLNPLPEQQGPNEGSGKILETISSKELAYHSTMYDWALFRNVHESELLHHIMGRTSGITSNLDRLMLRFNQIHHWVTTEVCLTASQTKRGHMLKKFIKTAGHCKEYHNLFGFCAIIMGLTNSAIGRLVQSWDKVPSKLQKTFREYESLMDPGRNHRSSRMLLHNLHPPIIPFMPLIMKDLTFTHEGNKTHFENLVNFEKMHMVADTLRLIRYCKSTDLNLPVPPVEKPSEFNIAAYVRNLRVIDNQRRLMQLSFKREQKKFEKNAKPDPAGAPAAETK